MSAPLSPERLAEIAARHGAAELGALYPAPEPFAVPGTIRSTIGGVPLTVAVMDFRGWKAGENRQFILRAHEDVRELLADRERFADRADMAARIAELELAVGSAVLGLHSISIRVNAGQVPDVAGLERDADELRQVQHGSVEGAESRLRTGHTEPPVVAYWFARSGELFCRRCCAGGGSFEAMTSEELADGGVCSACDTDVLIGGEPR